MRHSQSQVLGTTYISASLGLESRNVDGFGGGRVGCWRIKLAEKLVGGDEGKQHTAYHSDEGDSNGGRGLVTESTK